jgi:hypothetical protein
MTEQNLPLLERIKASCKELSVAATSLNETFDELGKSIEEMDSTLKELNLGITAWVHVSGRDEGETSWSHDIGYDRINDKWGIVIRTRSGSDRSPNQEEYEVWLFNDAPRRLRIEAVEKAPELCGKLVKEAESIAARIKGKFSPAPVTTTWQSEIETRCPTCLEVR